MTVSLRSHNFDQHDAGNADVIGLLDVGTTHIVCMIVAADATAASGFQLLGLGHQVSRGIKASMVVDLEAAQETIWSSIYQAQRMAGVSLDRVHVAAGGGRMEHLMVSSTVPTGRGILAAGDLARLDAAGLAYAQRDERVVLHLDRLQLGMDGVAVLRPRLGQTCHALKADFSIVTGDQVAVRNLRHTIESNSLQVASLSPAPVMAALAVTTEAEREVGVTVVDCGGGTTTLAMFAHGHLIGISTVPVGGNHLTFDIARQLQLPLKEAERIKLDCGSVGTAQSDDAAALKPQVADHSPAMTTPASRALIRHILTSRAGALLRSIAERLERFQASGAVQAAAGQQIVLAGGASRLSGFDGLACEILGRPVQHGRVRIASDFPQAVRTLPFAAAIGLMSMLPRPVLTARPPALPVGGFVSASSASFVGQ